MAKVKKNEGVCNNAFGHKIAFKYLFTQQCNMHNMSCVAYTSPRHNVLPRFGLILIFTWFQVSPFLSNHRAIKALPFEEKVFFFFLRHEEQLWIFTFLSLFLLFSYISFPPFARKVIKDLTCIQLM